MSLHARFHAGIGDIAAASWDALRTDDHPFLSHAFLQALEQTGCIRADWGWQPHHLGLYEQGRLVAAAPLYLKGNSHGEFVFDWSWASAYERAGGAYYPKLLNAVPYSPVTGPRLLAGNGPQTAILQRALVQAMVEEAERHGLSSIHANFLLADEIQAFDDEWLARSDVQYHWPNRGYASFDAFLATLNHKKRKNIRHERAQVAAAGLRIAMQPANDLMLADWRRIHALYTATFDLKGNHAALTAAFFSRLREFGHGVQIATARRDDTIIAMALFLQGDRTLYGRYWGASEEVPGMHFELCYYVGIEHAIAQQLERFEPGAQGRHKLARGFLPVRTQSRHYLLDEGFRRAVARALTDEAVAMDEHLAELHEHDPYARSTDGAG